MAAASNDGEALQLEKALLLALASAPIADSSQWISSTEFGAAKHGLLENIIRSLKASEFVDFDISNQEIVELSEEGQQYLANGSPEFQVYSAVLAAGAPVDQQELQSKFSESLLKLGQGTAMKNKWIGFDKATKKFSVQAQNVVDETASQLARIAAGAASELPAAALKALSQRKLTVLRKAQRFSVRQAGKFALERRKLATDLTLDMLKDNAWKNEAFKEYNFNSKGPELAHGCQHSMMRVREEFRQILIGMNFQEMPTNQYVESSFWNFDALFQPQQHPCRDSHDTFFLSSPARTNFIPEDYMARVREVHQTGGWGSIGYRYDWSEEKSRENILRTHTTAISARMLYEMGEQYQKTKVFEPKRYFSIDRVFRNETLDPTHLAEFHQVEGLVADRNLTLGDLIGTIQTFFSKIGISDVKFKPAYNPYTEPSMEIFGYSKELDKWMEVGNSGIFRPEMLLPMGLPPDVNVIAWGLSLERPTMIKFKEGNIRNLFGHKVKLPIIANAPIARYDTAPQSYSPQQQAADEAEAKNNN